MADTTRVRVLDIDASKSTQSIAGLKNEIKDLKDRLAGLTEGTEEYNEVLTECAEKTHQLKEIQEQVNRTSQDFGDRMSNVRGVIGGMSGAIGAITGALSLMGVEAEKDSELIRLMVSAMSITSGIQAIDAGVKSFRALTISINAASAASRKLYASLGVIGIILGVVAAAIYSVKKAEEEAEEAAIEAQRGRIQRLDEFQEKLSQFEHDYEEDAGRILDSVNADDFGDLFEAQFDQYVIAVQHGFTEIAEAGRNGVTAYGGTLISEMQKLNTKLTDEWKTISDNMRNDAEWENSEEGIEALRVYYEGRIQYMEMAYAKELQLFRLHKDEMSIEEQTAHYEALAQIRSNLAELLREQQKYFDKAATARTNNHTKTKQEIDRANAELIKQLKDRYNIEIAEIKIAHSKGEIDDIEYHQRLYNALVAHNKRMLRQVKQSQAEIKQAELAEIEAALAVNKAIIEQYEKDAMLTINRQHKNFDAAIDDMKRQVAERMRIEQALTDVMYGEMEKRKEALEQLRTWLESEQGQTSVYFDAFAGKLTMAWEAMNAINKNGLFNTEYSIESILDRIDEFFANTAKVAEKWSGSIVEDSEWLGDMFSGEANRIKKAMTELTDYMEQSGDVDLAQGFRKSFLENATWLDNLLSGEASRVGEAISQMNNFIEELGDVDISDKWIVNLMQDEVFLTNLLSDTASKRTRALAQFKEQLADVTNTTMSDEWKQTIISDEKWLDKFFSASVNDRREAMEELNDWMTIHDGSEVAKKWAGNMEWMANVTSEEFSNLYTAYKQFFKWLGGDALNDVESYFNRFDVLQEQMLSENAEDRKAALEALHADLLELEMEEGSIRVENLTNATDNMFFYYKSRMKENIDDQAAMEEFLTRMTQGNLDDRTRAYQEYAEWVEKRSEELALNELMDEQAVLEGRQAILDKNYENTLKNIDAEYEAKRAVLMKELEMTDDIDKRREISQQLITLEQETVQARLDAQVQYASDVQQLELDITANERDQVAQRIAMAKSEKEKKQQLMQSYMSAVSSSFGYASQLISAIQQNIDTETEAGFEKNKQYQRANAIISYFQGLISAWSSAMQLTYPMNVIVGAANSALLTGIFAANLAQINATTFQSSGGAAQTNTVTLQSIEHSPTNVRQTTTSSDYEELNEREGDRRVYVLASDIEEVTGGRKAQVSNATY